MMLKSNFGLEQSAPVKESDERAEYRKKAIESIAGSMVFVEDELIYWDISNER